METVKAKDEWAAGEGTKHDRHSAVLTQVGDCLHATAGQVQVGDLSWPQDAERVESLWRDVDVAIR